MWKQLNIHQKLSLGFLLVIFLTSIVGAIAYVSLTKVELYLKSNNGPSLAYISEHIKKLDLEIESDINKYLLVNEGNLEEVRYKFEEVIKQLKGINQETKDPDVRDILKSIEDYVIKYKNIISALKSSGITKTERKKFIESNIFYASQILSLTDRLNINIHNKILYQRTVSLGMVKHAKTILFLVILATLAISIIVSFILANKLTDPLILLSKKAEAIGKGDWNGAINIFGNDEIGKLANVLEKMKVKLKNAYGNLENRIELTNKDLQKLNTELQELLEYNKNIIASMSSGLVVINVNKKVTTFNRAAENILKINSQDILHKNIYSIPKLKKIGRLLIATISLREPKETEINIQLEDDLNLSLGITTSPMSNGALAIFVDLSDRKRLITRLIEDEKFVEAGRLASGIAHEINNPLSSITTTAELILDNKDQGDRVLHWVKLMANETERIALLIQNLQSFAKIKELQKDLVDVNTIIHDTLSLIEYQLKISAPSKETF